MAYLGTIPLAVTTTGAGPVSVAVPAGAQGAIVTFRANFGTFALSSNFAGTWVDLTTAGSFTRMFAAPVTSTAAGRTITFNFGSYLSEGCLAFVSFFDELDNSSLATWVRDAKCEETYELTINSQDTDIVFGSEFWYTESAGTPPNQSGWTSQSAPSPVNGAGGRARTLDAPGSSTSTISAQYAAGGDYNSLAIVSIIQTGSTPPPDGPLLSYWNGTAWVEKPLKMYDGSAWVPAPLFRWNGSAWVAVP